MYNPKRFDKKKCPSISAKSHTEAQQINGDQYDFHEVRIFYDP